MATAGRQYSSKKDMNKINKKLKKYIRPKIITKKIKVNFFLTNKAWIDKSIFTGSIYLASGEVDATGAGDYG